MVRREGEREGGRYGGKEGGRVYVSITSDELRCLNGKTTQKTV